MGNHTPGPWTIESRPTGGFDIDADFEDQQRERVAFATNPSNARLVAAAPDLLAALQAIVCHEQGVQQYRLAQARAAIARATEA